MMRKPEASVDASHAGVGVSLATGVLRSRASYVCKKGQPKG